MVVLELVDVPCLVANVAAEAAEAAVGGVGVAAAAADVGGVAVVVVVVVVAAAAAVDMVSSNVMAHEDLTCDDNLACHYPSSHFGVGDL